MPRPTTGVLAATLGIPLAILFLAAAAQGERSRDSSTATLVTATVTEAVPTPTATPEARRPQPDHFAYTVRPGDTLRDIAATFVIPTGSLREHNAIDDADDLAVGEVLAIPLDGAAPPPRADTLPEVREALHDAERVHGLPHGLLLALAWYESRWDRDAVSSAGAIGLVQVLPATAAWVEDTVLRREVDWQTSISGNADVGAAYLRYLLDWADEDVSQALAAYYQGPRAIADRGPDPRTRRYVESILALVNRFQ